MVKTYLFLIGAIFFEVAGTWGLLCLGQAPSPLLGLWLVGFLPASISWRIIRCIHADGVDISHQPSVFAKRSKGFPPLRVTTEIVPRPPGCGAALMLQDVNKRVVREG